MNSIITKYFFLTFLVLPIWINAFSSDKNRNAKEEFCENFISITGASNLNQFFFKNNNLNFNHLELHHFTYDTPNEINSQTIEIQVSEFECKNKTMYNDFQKLLKASEYPNVNISLAQNEVIQFEKENSNTDFNINISLAGVTKNYDLPCEIIPCGNSEFLLKGEKRVKLTDFQIDPPIKVFGVIKVEDTVFINFAFRFILKEI